MSAVVRGAGLVIASLATVAWAGTGPAEVRLHVSVAASLRPPLERILEQLGTTHPGTRVWINAGGSGVLLTQALRGAPVDVLVSASPRELDRLDSEGMLLAGSRRVVASNRLVIVVPRGARPPRDLAQLAATRFGRIAVGNPRTAPLGVYTAQALEAAGLGTVLAKRLVPGESARPVSDWIARHEVDAAIVYASDARSYADRLALGPAIPAELHDPILYEAAVSTRCEHPAEALALVELLGSAEGRRVLLEHGFAAAP